MIWNFPETICCIRIAGNNPFADARHLGSRVRGQAEVEGIDGRSDQVVASHLVVIHPSSFLIK
jgi:hypothetical protein